MPGARDTPTPIDLFGSAVREDPVDLGLACGLIGLAADSTADVTASLSALDAYAALARPLLLDATTPTEQADALRIALGEHAGFSGYAEDYADLRSSLLHEVLQRRRGLPILLTVVWVEVARRLGVRAYPIALPGHVVVGIGDPDGEYALADPFHGGRLLSGHDAAEIVRQSGLPFHHRHLEPAPSTEVLLRVLANIRRLAVDREDTVTRLWAVRLSLAVPDHPAALRRELGEVLGRSGDYLAGSAELAAYADGIEAAEPAAAEAARRSAQMLRARLN